MNSTRSGDDVLSPSASPRKREFFRHIEANVEEQEYWRKLNSAYYDDDRKFMQFLIPPGKRVLEVGCGRGDLLAALAPAYGVGVDFSPSFIAKAKALHPDLHFILGDAEDP